jgi:choline dehydrogenase
MEDRVVHSADFVIVGGGSAGAVLAARLSADPARTVVLLEAGPDSAGIDEISVPAAFPTLFRTAWDWTYDTTPQPGLDDRSAYWPRMRALGGCSAMNAMIYMRGNAADYNSWESEHGAKGWNYADLLPYFIKSERNQRGANAFHGDNGPLHVEDRKYTHPTVEAFVEAAVEAGHPRNDDHNGARQEGAGLYQVTTRRGLRWSTRDAYLAPAFDRQNLQIMTEAHATKVIIDQGRAVGVAYRHQGADHQVFGGEIILAAGSIGSPQLLMLSGIGPGQHLRDLGLPVHVDNAAVGANLSDHPVAPLVWFTKNTDSLTDYQTPARLMQAKFLRRGPLTSNVGEGGLFFATSHATDGLPNIQVHSAGAAFFDNGLHESPGRAFTAGPTLVEIHSRGKITLKSANPYARPLIDAGYFTDRRDLDAIVEGCLTTKAIVEESKTMRHFIKGQYLGHATTADEMRAHVRHWGQTLYHPVGTCAIGTVVDSALRVDGIEGLRVVDASVMPTVPRGNTNAPTIAIAEKAADLINSGA